MAEASSNRRWFTFMMTDVEGSTERWNREAADMSRSMKRHNEIIAAAVGAAGGLLLDGEGDSQAAAFRSAAAALHAAGEIQETLRTSTLPVPLAVRIGIHDGEVFELGPSLFGGAPLCFLGRLHKAGHGGQILLSESVVDRLAADLSPGWTLVDLGDHVFRDFNRRRVFQADRAGSPMAFPPLSAPRPSAVPAGPGTSFIGREAELETARRGPLPDRVTTLAGPSGIGKTRLALEMARYLEPHHREGVTVVELAGATPEQVPVAVAGALYVNPQLESTPHASLVRSLRGRQLLLVLDNCEHVLDQVRDLIANLEDLPGVRFLLTSRLPLSIHGERVLTVLPLGVPAPTDPLESAAETEAVCLLIDRAATARPGFKLTEDNLMAVIELSRQLAGVPLEVELGAAALRSISVEDLSGELADHPPDRRSQTSINQRARTGLDWSLLNLDPGGQQVMEHLAVFPGGASLTDLASLAGTDQVRLRPTLYWLAERALIRFDGSAGSGVYQVLEPLRHESLRRLAPGRRHELEVAHADLIASLAMELGAAVQGPGESAAVDRLEQLWASIRSQVAHDTAANVARATEVCLTVHEHSMLRMRFEPYEWISRLLAHPALDPCSEASLRALSCLGAFHRGDMRTAQIEGERSLQLSEEQGLEPMVQAHFGLMVAHGFSGDFGRAQIHFEQAARWCSQEGRSYFMVNTLVLAAMAMTIQGDTNSGVAIARNAVERAEEIGNPSCLAWGLAALADAERQASPGAAHVHLDEALAAARRVRSRWVEGQALLNLATLWYATSKEDSAAVLVDALTNVQRTGSPIHGRQALRLALILLADFGRHDQAALFQWAARRDQESLPPATDVAESLRQAHHALGRHLGSDVAEALGARGRRQPDDELVTVARSALIEAAGL